MSHWLRLGALAAFLAAGLFAAAAPGEPGEGASSASAPSDGVAEADPPRQSGAPAVRGLALGLFSEDLQHDYTPQLEEIAQLGATHVAIVVTWFQRDVNATEIYADDRRTPPNATVRQTVRAARRLGLRTFLFPYVRVADKHSPDDWRGSIAPSDRAAWHNAYGDWIEGLARLAAREQVDILSLGSEMSSTDVDTAEWRALIRRVRAIFPGQLTYSANWDHYDRVEFWDDLDLVGLTGYFELVAPDEHDPSVEEIVHGWREWHVRLMRWQATHGRPLLLTEVGYRSNDGAAAQPWRWGQEEEQVDLAEQRDAYEAFARVWSHEPRLGGVFFWNWWGEGGHGCSDYTPRGKPAADLLGHWLGGGPPSPASAETRPATDAAPAD